MQNWVFDIRSRPFFLLIGVFLLLTYATYHGVLEQPDVAITNYMQTLGGQNDTLDVLMQIATETGDVYYMLGFAILLLIIRRTRRIGVSLMIALVIVTIVTGYTKCITDRDRPELEYFGSGLPIGEGADTFSLFCNNGYNASYPSGHAGRAAVFGLVLGVVLYQRMGTPTYLILLYPIIVSISRIYILEHYTSDIIGGIILGLLIAGIIAKKARLYETLKNSKS